MQRIIRKVMLLAMVGLFLPITTGPTAAGNDILGQALKGAAIGFAVTKFATPLDKFINTITLRNGMSSKMATKVVPILSVGEKGYIGGAQVSGPAAQVATVKAVFQYEKNFSNNNYRAKVLLPSASLNPLKLQRAPKVGVTAIIDYSLDGNLRYKTVGTGIQTGDVIRGAALLIAVKNFGSSINNTLNTLTFNKGYNTKLVPMASVGEKMYLGGGQISASDATIIKVNALWQYEDMFSGGQFRVKIMVPTTSTNPLKMKRVDGAGITAVVEMALSEQKDITQGKSKKETVIYKIGGILKGSDDNKKSREIEGRKDNGLHKGWEIGKHKGWDKKK